MTYFLFPWLILTVSNALLTSLKKDQSTPASFTSLTHLAASQVPTNPNSLAAPCSLLTLVASSLSGCHSMMSQLLLISTSLHQQLSYKPPY